MEEALHEKDELKMRVHSYITEVSRIEKLMATKVSKHCPSSFFWLCVVDAVR